MWFKNLALFRLTEAFDLSAAELEQKLEQQRFRPCGTHQEFSVGWTSPIGRSSEQLIHASNGFLMVCAQKEEKVIPAAVIKEMTLEKIQEAEDQQARKLSKKECTAIKDELIFDLLPKAFSFSRRTFAFFDPKGSWLIVDAASAKKAEDLVSLLRKCLGSLSVVPPSTKDKPSATMTQWLLNMKAPADINIEDECELRSKDEESGIIRCKRHDLALPEIKNHLENGKHVLKLAVSWSDRLSFIMDENLTIKRLRFLDLILDQAAEIEAGDESEQFDIDFSIMSLELAHFLPRLMDIFGGENHTNAQTI